jgi:hypothetical protein
MTLHRTGIKTLIRTGGCSNFAPRQIPRLARRFACPRRRHALFNNLLGFARVFLQPFGKRPLAAADWWRGLRDIAGARLGE